jgi:hypothetical protein
LNDVTAPHGYFFLSKSISEVASAIFKKLDMMIISLFPEGPAFLMHAY